jgi:signal transduction histidine kinase
VSDLFDIVAERHEREIAVRGIRLTRAIAPGAEEVAGDPDRLGQALLNLAANALRHVPDGGTLALSADCEGAYGVRLVVHDSGPGIPPEHLSRVFDRFYKVDVSRGPSGGSGLGLSLVKAIVECHGGQITARNDHGAVFEILLPRGEIDEGCVTKACARAM